MVPSTPSSLLLQQLMLVMMVMSCHVDALTQVITECPPHSDDDKLCYSSAPTSCESVPSSVVRLTSPSVRHLRVTSSSVPVLSDEHRQSLSHLTVYFSPAASYRTSDGGGLKYEVRLTSYSRRQKNKSHRSADFTSCVLVTVHGLSAYNTSIQLQLQYRTNKPVSPAIYLVQVLNLSPRVVDGSTYLVPQALVNVLPKRQDEYIEYKDDASWWTVDTVVQNDSCQRTVSIQFEFAPTHFGFTAYRVMLARGRDRWHTLTSTQDGDDHEKLVRMNESGSATHGHVVFKNVSNGVYVVKVEPERCVELCMQSMSALFLVQHPGDEECAIKYPPSITTHHIIAIVIGCVTAVLIVCATALLIYLCTTVVAPWRRRTALVIYEYDCRQHVDVIRQLTQFLETRCNFEVLSELTRREEIRQSRADFVRKSLERADVVLVVVSEDLRAAWQEHRHTSVAELLLRHLRTEEVLRPKSVKLVAVRFDYTPANTRVDTQLARVPEVYELMADFDRLLFSLRGVNRCTQLLNLTHCLRLAPVVSSLKESVAVARQHYQQQQVPVTEPAACSLPQHDDTSLSSEHSTLLNNSSESLQIDQRISQLNRDYDNYNTLPMSRLSAASLTDSTVSLQSGQWHT